MLLRATLQGVCNRTIENIQNSSESQSRRIMKVPLFKYRGPVAGLMPALRAAAALLATQTANK